MKTNFRRVLELSVLAFFVSLSVTACATSPDAQKQTRVESTTASVITDAHKQAQLKRADVLFNKLFGLVNVACNIYPALPGTDECVDRVSHGMLSIRGVSPLRQDEIIAQVHASIIARSFANQNDKHMTAADLHQIELGNQLLNVARASCALEPAITDLEVCMDMAYHGIISSRDPHSNYFSKAEADSFLRRLKGNLQGVGTEIALTEDKTIGVIHVLPHSPAEKAGVLAGDRIIAVINDNERVLTSSFATINEAVKKIKGKPNTDVTLEILRGKTDKLVIITVTRGEIKLEMVKAEIITAPNDPNTTYAYVKLAEFGNDFRQTMAAAVKAALAKEKGVKGIIFDVRGNPGGLLKEVYEAVDALADSPDALVSIRNNSGIHAYGTAPDENPPEPQPGDVTGGLPMVVLVDGHSASASEIFAGALKELDRAVIIGTRTWSKGTVQSIIPGRDGDVLDVTQGEYLVGSPTKWVAVQCVGVEPDILYEAEVFWKPKKTMHECDLPRAIVSGGLRSDPSMLQKPLRERDPARYVMGERMLEAVKALDHNAFVKDQQIRKQLKITPPKDEPEEKGK